METIENGNHVSIVALQIVFGTDFSIDIHTQPE